MFVAVVTNAMRMTKQKNGESLVFKGCTKPLNELWNHLPSGFLLIK